MAVEPVGVPSDAKSNSTNHKGFFGEHKTNTYRLDRLERGSIRGGSVGGAGFSFFQKKDSADPDKEVYGGVTARIGEFKDYYFDLSTNSFSDDPVDVRGLSLFLADEDFSWFSVGSYGDIQSFNIGYAGTTVESVLMKALYLRFDSALNTGARMEFTTTGDIVFTRYGSSIRFTDLPSIGAGDHLVLDGGALKYVSSARKYKQDIEDAVIDPNEVLLMQGRTWRDRAEVAENPDTERRFVGFIADELAEFETLKQFVRFNENQEPETIYYDRLVVGVIELFKTQQIQINDQQDQISNQNEHIEVLEEKLATLQDMVESIL